MEQNKMTNKVAALIARVGVDNCLAAAEYYRNGEGSSTVAFYLSLHHRTASAAMDAGLLLPSVR